MQERVLPNGKRITLDKDNPKKMYDEIITKFVKPFYEESNDWNVTIKNAITQIERISQIMNLSKGDSIEAFLVELEQRLHKDFEDLAGTDKIEILFEALDDYVENMAEIIESSGTKEEIRLRIAKLVENLNLFEMSELLLYYAKKNQYFKNNCN